MYLIINPSSGPEEWRLAIIKNGVETGSLSFGGLGPGAPLAALSVLLNKVKVKLTDLSGVAVLVGRGRFSATRLAATLANTLVFALGLKAAAVISPDPKAITSLLDGVPKGRYLSAAYSGEPRIGVKAIKQKSKKASLSG